MGWMGVFIMNERQLLELKTSVQEKLEEARRLQGKMDALKDQLKEQGFASVKKAERALKDLEKKIEEAEEEIEVAYTDLRERFHNALQ